MIVVCPKCNKRYQVEDHLIQSRGRQVRCAACGHVWLHVPDLISELSQNPQVQGMKDVTSKTRKIRKLPTAAIGWCSFAVCSVFFLSYTLLQNEYVASQFDYVRSLQNLLGTTNESPGTGLSLTNTQIQEISEGHFIVRGHVLNTSKKVQKLSVLNIKALGEKGCEHPTSEGKCILKEWKLELDQESLLPGEQMSFESSPYPLIQGTRTVGVSF